MGDQQHYVGDRQVVGNGQTVGNGRAVGHGQSATLPLEIAKLFRARQKLDISNMLSNIYISIVCPSGAWAMGLWSIYES